MHYSIAILWLVIFLAGCGVRETKLDPAEAKARVEYNGYVEPYRKAPRASGVFGPRPMGLSLKATIVKGETDESALAPTNHHEAALRVFRIDRMCAAVCTNGRISIDWTVGLRGAPGPGGRVLSDWELNTRLKHLLSQLPDDGGRLPPVGQRVILQVPAGDAWRVRVYNGSNAPTEVQQVLQLIGLKLKR